MRFNPTAEHTYWWPIKIVKPHPEKSGQWLTESFEMRFASVSSDEAERISKQIAELKTDEERAEHEHDQLLNVSRDWRGVEDDDKQPVPYTREMLLAMLKAAPWYRAGIYSSYARSLVRDEARKGN